MSAKEVMGGSRANEMGTAVAAYSEQGPFHCDDCVFLKVRGKPSPQNGLCNQKVMLKDPKVKTDKKTGLKIVNMEHGCCRYVKYAKGYREESNEKD